MAADKGYPYTTVPNNLKRLMEKLPALGKPEKASQEWLASVGFPGGNNKRSLAVLRQVGVISSGGQPTPLFDALRSKDRVAFAEGIRTHYADLFSTYPDADRKDTEALIAFVRSKTDYGEDVQRLAVRTFKVLVEFGDFTQGAAAKTLDRKDGGDDAASGRGRRRGTSKGDGEVTETGRVALTVNIQLQLPPNAEGDVYEKLFAAMGKHLKGLVTFE